ncbi:MAG: MBL fold metallo-hydrolase [Gemmatimonadales bacterium]|nr:MBL fold metallo-hydrolase [Gemmatimonadales bacterium]NCG31525.1 MBL fold metallo-hydrolase [Pseudomonadota bacterium]MBT3499234.1 MBL fold metallo-hydrolase [Gemmatimonadales bacterium]MBT3774023.1 MBL fold metallo-hydrolase [Gemmatimonadales bacterium]MBT3959787.1 MBL fold metallo-hydrolase [Gemmatimonadales bacterium]
MRDHLRFLNAGNVGPFTLDGTRTYLVGTKSVAMIDPGPDVGDHVRALAMAVESVTELKILLTHGHPDHAAAVGSVAQAVTRHAAERASAGSSDRFSMSVWGPKGVAGVDHVLADGDLVVTDVGSLIALHTPGHTREHLCFHWERQDALFVGDLLLGEGDTTWVAEYEGCVADYLDSLARLRSLGLKLIYPAHGAPLEDPTNALDRFESHRRERIAQVAAALADHPGADAARLLEVVYGDTLPKGMRAPALQSLGALLEYVRSVVEH